MLYILAFLFAQFFLIFLMIQSILPSFLFFPIDTLLIATLIYLAVRNKKRKNDVIEKSGYSFPKIYKINDCMIAIDKQKRVLLLKDASLEEPQFIPWEKVQDYEEITDTNTLAGHQLFLSGKPQVSKLILRISVDDIEKPQYVIKFLDIPGGINPYIIGGNLQQNMDYWVGILKYILNDNKKSNKRE